MRRWFAHLEVKAVCLLLAVGLWFYVDHLRLGGADTSSVTRSTLHLMGVPVQLKGSRTAQFHPRPSSVEITVEWFPQDPVQVTALDSIYAVIPTDSLEAPSEGPVRYMLGLADFVLPPGWRLVEVVPKEITLEPLQGSP